MGLWAQYNIMWVAFSRICDLIANCLETSTIGFKSFGRRSNWSIYLKEPKTGSRSLLCKCFITAIIFQFLPAKQQRQSHCFLCFFRLFSVLRFFQALGVIGIEWCAVEPCVPYSISVDRMIRSCPQLSQAACWMNASAFLYIIMLLCIIRLQMVRCTTILLPNFICLGIYAMMHVF